MIQGIAYVLLAAVCFGFMPLMGSWADKAGVGTWMLLALRFAMAAPILWAIVLIRKERVPRGRVLLALIGMGAIGYFAEASCFFLALKYIPSGLVSLLLYLYPGLVTLIAWLFLKEKLSQGKMIALVLAVIGSGLLLIPSLFGQSLGPEAWKGILLGLVMAVSYALYIIAGAKFAKDAGPMVSSAIVVSSAAAVFVGVALAKGEALPTSALGWQAAMSLSIFATVIGITALLAGLARIGPVRTSTLSIMEPAVTVAVGVSLLDEKFSPWQWVGGACVLIAAIVTARAK